MQACGSSDEARCTRGVCEGLHECRNCVRAWQCKHQLSHKFVFFLVLFFLIIFILATLDMGEDEVGNGVLWRDEGDEGSEGRATEGCAAECRTECAREGEDGRERDRLLRGAEDARGEGRETLPCSRADNRVLRICSAGRKRDKGRHTRRVERECKVVITTKEVLETAEVCEDSGRVERGGGDAAEVGGEDARARSLWGRSEEGAEEGADEGGGARAEVAAPEEAVREGREGDAREEGGLRGEARAGGGGACVEVREEDGAARGRVEVRERAAEEQRDPRQARRGGVAREQEQLAPRGAHELHRVRLQRLPHLHKHAPELCILLLIRTLRKNSCPHQLQSTRNGKTPRSCVVFVVFLFHELLFFLFLFLVFVVTTLILTITTIANQRINTESLTEGVPEPGVSAQVDGGAKAVRAQQDCSREEHGACGSRGVKQCGVQHSPCVHATHCKQGAQHIAHCRAPRCLCCLSTAQQHRHACCHRIHNRLWRCTSVRIDGRTERCTDGARGAQAAVALSSRAQG